MGDIPDRVDPSGIPTFTGFLGQLELDHAALISDAAAFREIGESVHNRFQGLSSCYKAPESEQLLATTTTVQARSDEFAGQLETVAGALSEYLEAIRPVVTRLNQLRSDAETFVWSLDEDWTYDTDKVALNNQLIADVSTTVGQFWEAERTAANKILALFSRRQWTADDGSGGENMYGANSGDLAAAAETPWGKTVTEDHEWDEFGYHLKSFVWDGVIVDGLWGTLTGLATLANPFDADCLTAWEGVFKLATGVIALSTPGAWSRLSQMPPGPLKDWFDESAVVATEFGKSLIAWDEWEENPAKASGIVAFNVVTAIASLGAGTAVEGMGLTAKAVSTLARIGEIIDPMTYVAKGVGASFNGLRTVGELTGKLIDPGSWKGVGIPGDEGVLFPDGTILRPDGTLEFPDDTVQLGGDAPVEMSGDDLAVLDDTAAAMDGTDLPDGTPARTPVPVASVGGQAPFDGADNLGGGPTPKPSLPGSVAPDLPGGGKPPPPPGSPPFGPGTAPRPPLGGSHLDDAADGADSAADDAAGSTDDTADFDDDWLLEDTALDDLLRETDVEDGLPARDAPPPDSGYLIADDAHLLKDLDAAFPGPGDRPPLPRPVRPGAEVGATADIERLLNWRQLSDKQLRGEIQRALNGTFGADNLRVHVTYARHIPEQGTLTWQAEILGPDGVKVGETERRFRNKQALRLVDNDYRLVPGPDVIVVEHHWQRISEGFQKHGFGTDLRMRLEDWYRESGVDRIELTASDANGGYTWAKAGYSFNGRSHAHAAFLQLRQAIGGYGDMEIPPPSQAEIDAARELLRRSEELPFGSPGYPQPADIAAIGEFGKNFLLKSRWPGVKFL
ncbi:hypothetical protein [Yinghuangia sp. YIM S09857]|uniref:hypothetical protein n=1 Tax=Yinghuangia sp. YIM S09857 TaxID=3436929 RepID=UPI003F52AC81